jgi:hypothetical protein
VAVASPLASGKGGLEHHGAHGTVRGAKHALSPPYRSKKCRGTTSSAERPEKERSHGTWNSQNSRLLSHWTLRMMRSNLVETKAKM